MQPQIQEIQSLHGEAKPSDLTQNMPQPSARNKRQLNELLSQICALQKQYGKTQQELETLVEGFAWALADYPMPKILKAMRKYILRNSDIPAPADIIKIIEGDKWKENFRQPDIETLRRYQAKGIPLSVEQKKILGATP